MYFLDICLTDPSPNTAPANDNCRSFYINSSNLAAQLELWQAQPYPAHHVSTYKFRLDVWYSFTATSAFPTITLSGVGTNICTSYIQLFSVGCGTLTEIACISGTSLLPGGTGLTVGNTYYVRIYSPSSYNPGATGWVAIHRICDNYNSKR
jgi:hypothetical protein